MSVRGDILDDVKTVLEGITTGNGFFQTINKVDDQSIRAPEDINDEEFPILFITDGDENKKPGDVDSKDCVLTIIITGIIKQQNDEDDIQDRRRKIQNDVEKALMAQESRGGKAIRTEITQISTDKGLSQTYTLFQLDLDVDYFHNRSDPSSQDNSPGP